MPEERKLVTVLFADIVGSTALGGSHSPELVRKTLAQAFARAREVLSTHGGTVEKFVGDAVMAVFGVPVAHDDDADRAVRAAFALRGAVAELRAVGPLALELRIGVNSGEVVAGSEAGSEFLVTGEPVNVAARLQQSASPGEILVGGLTRRLTTSTVRYGPVRAVEAKGLGAIEAFAVEELTVAVPEQPRGIAGLRAPLVGRDEEMRLLLDAHRRTTRERRAYLVTVYGPAGAGKSRLTQEFVDTIGAERVRRGRCLPYGQGITFWPVQEILRADASVSATDSREDAERKLRSAVLGAFGEASEDADAVAKRLAVLAGTSRPEDVLAGVSSENVPQELRWALRRYLERRAGEVGLTVVIEDIHWAEPALLDLVDHVIDWARAPLFVLCLARPELLDVRPGWGGGKMNAAAISLDPLSDEETGRLIAALLEIEALPEKLRAEVIAKAEGNPLYVEEFIRMLIDAGRIERRGERWVASRALGTLEVPPTIQGLIAARLDRLAPEVKRVLQRAALVGKVFWTDALRALDGSRPVEDLLLESARRDLVVELDERGLGGGQAYRFKHILIRDVAYASLPLEERAALHDRFARWLEETAGERLEEYADIVAYHAEQAFLFAREMESPDALPLGRRAFERLMPSAAKARRRWDMHAALVVYERAASVGEASGVDPAELAEAQGLATLARSQLEGTPEALARLDEAIVRARAAGPSEALVEMLTWRAFYVLQDSVDTAARLFAEAVAASRAIGDPDLIAHALVWSHWHAWWIGDLDAHRRVLEDARAYIGASGARRGLGECLTWLSLTLGHGGEWGRALALGREALALARDSGSKIGVWTASHHIGFVLRWSGDHAQAVGHHEQSLAVAREIGAPALVARSCEHLGDDLYAAGDLARSREVLEEGLAMLDPESMRDALPELQWKLSRTCLALGDLPAARSHADAGRASVAATDVYSQVSTRAALAAVRLAEGDAAEAERLYREALTIIDATGYRALAVRVRTDLARLLMADRRAAEARPLLETALAYYVDPLAARRRAEVEALLRRCDEVAAG